MRRFAPASSNGSRLSRAWRLLVFRACLAFRYRRDRDRALHRLLQSEDSGIVNAARRARSGRSLSPSGKVPALSNIARWGRRRLSSPSAPVVPHRVARGSGGVWLTTIESHSQTLHVLIFAHSAGMSTSSLPRRMSITIRKTYMSRREPCMSAVGGPLRCPEWNPPRKRIPSCRSRSARDGLATAVPEAISRSFRCRSSSGG